MSILSMIVSGKEFNASVSGTRVKHLAPCIRCKDGTILSVQASGLLHYCAPKNDVGPYTAVEVACAVKLPELEKYKDPAPGSPVYAYVPVELVEQCIENRGGEKERRRS